jgi:cell volume regulation protein A
MFSLGAAAITHEPEATAVLLLVLGTLVATSVLFSRMANRLGVPVALFFLVLGMLGGSEGIGGVEFENYGFAVRLGTAALVLILFDGGLNTSSSSIRSALLPAMALATVGVALTAGLVAVSARLFGVPWPQALLLGAVVSPTDAAAIFAMLRGAGLRLKPRVGHVIEVESCLNDPMAVILTTGMIEFAKSGAGAGHAMQALLWEVPIQLAVGAGMGFIFGYTSRLLLRRAHRISPGLLPALTLAIALLSFAAATLCRGSGFLAVYVTAVVLGNWPTLPYRSGLVRVHDALAWLAQIAMFLMLGLLAFPSRLPGIALPGIFLGLFLGFVARPLAVLACLWPFRYPLNQSLYIGLVGLRGAVPIILATFPVLAAVPGAGRVFDIILLIVVVNSLVPGALIRRATRLLDVGGAQREAPTAVLEINSPRALDGELASFLIEPALAVCGARLSEIPLPGDSGVMLVVRGNALLAARGDTRLLEGDHVYVFFHAQERPLVELLFGGPEEGE